MRKAIFGLAALGTVLCAAAQFLPLFHTRVASAGLTVGSVSVGSDHSWSVLILAALAAFLAASVLVAGNRFALALIGAIGIVVLVIALSHDLSDARGHGLERVGLHYLSARNVVGAGLYVEIVGALVLMGAAVFGFGIAASGLAPIGSGRAAAKAPDFKRNREGRRRDSSDRPTTGADRTARGRSAP